MKYIMFHLSCSFQSKHQMIWWSRSSTWRIGWTLLAALDCCSLAFFGAGEQVPCFVAICLADCWNLIEFNFHCKMKFLNQIDGVSLPTWLRQHFDPSRVDNIDGYFLSSCKAIIIWCLVCALVSMCFGKVSWLEKSWMTKTWQVGFDIMCVLKKNPINTKHLSFNLQLKLCQNW